MSKHTRNVLPFMALLPLIACGAQDTTPQPSPPESSPTTPSPTPTDADTSPTNTAAITTPTATVASTPTESAPTETPPPTATDTPTPTPVAHYSATLRYTTNGVVHILADTLASASYGQGYAFAGYQACTLLDQVNKVTSQRARYFGAGSDNRYIDSDFTMLHLKVMEDSARILPELSQDIKQSLTGFVAGFNRFLEEKGPEGLGPECSGQPWVKNISETELMAYYLSMAILSSGQALSSGIARAQPPTSKDPAIGIPLPAPDLKGIELGSNGWAIGGDRSANGRGMLVANPHFPWEGELRFFESHVTVPGVINGYGVALLGSAVANMGFNENIAWTHTVSPASRMTFYRLSLGQDPTQYRYNGRLRDMIADSYTIQVLGEDGTLSPLNRTLYSSHWGPIVSTEEAGWTDRFALTFRDANGANAQMIPQFLGMSQAEDLAHFEAVHRDTHGIPWVNTIATDKEGNALYVDASSVPNLSEETTVEWLTALNAGDPLTVFAWSLGVPLLEGDTDRNEWVETPGESRPGLVPYDEAPRLLRRDWVLNANDSHWLSNPAEPLTGYTPLYGSERTPRSPRTRLNLMMLSEEGPDTALGEDGVFELEELQRLILDNRTLTSELLLDEVSERCNEGDLVIQDAVPIDISQVCAALSSFDGRMELSSTGAAPWREFIGAFATEDLYDASPLWAEPFDPNDPINTPRGLAPAPAQGEDPIRQALATATTLLATAEIDPAAPLGDIQFTKKGDENIAIHGGNGLEGTANIAVYSGSTLLNTSTAPRMTRGTVINSRTDLTSEGYVINYGTSFLMTLSFTDDGPVATALLSYSQSGVPDSPHYSDQTHRFSDKDWRTIPFTEEAIAADPNLIVVELNSAP